MREPESSKFAQVYPGNSNESANVYHCAPVPPENSFSGTLIQVRILLDEDFLLVEWYPFCEFILRVLPESGQVIVQSNNYWSGLEYAPNPSNAWNFNFNNCYQNNNNKNNNFFALAVRPGE